MSTTPNKRRPRTGAGFTLIEIMAVVLIFLLIAAVILPRVSLVASQRLLDDGRELAASLDFARERAQATARAHRVVLDLDAGRYWIEEKPLAPPTPPTLAWAELDDLPLVAPRADGAEYVRVPGTPGSPRSLESGVAFAGIESDAGAASEGLAALAFAPDGSAPPARIWLASGDSLRGSVDMAALADPTTFALADAQ